MKILIIVGIVIILMIIGIYNSITRLKMKVKQSKSGIDVYLQQRFDLIPNLIETVKGYMKHEKDVFSEITQLRSQYNETKDLKVSEDLNSQLNDIMAVAEAYPELQANEQFMNLQKNLSKMESQLQAARRIYNNDVTEYNTKISIFPYNIFAALLGFKLEALFEVTQEDVRKNVNVKK